MDQSCYSSPEQTSDEVFHIFSYWKITSVSTWGGSFNDNSPQLDRREKNYFNISWIREVYYFSSLLRMFCLDKLSKYFLLYTLNTCADMQEPGDVQNAERLNGRCAKHFCNLKNMWKTMIHCSYYKKERRTEKHSHDPAVCSLSVRMTHLH